MKILKAKIRNFGLFEEKTVSFQEGLNLYEDGNGSGKSTIHAFLKAMLYGLTSEECVRWQSRGGNGRLAGKMWFECRGKNYVLERDFSKGKEQGILFCQTDGKSLDLEKEEFRNLLPMSEGAFENTFFVPQRGAGIDQKLAEELRRYLTGKGEGAAWEKRKKLQAQRSRLLEEKKDVQVDLISRQQEVRMRMDYVEQEMERLKKEQEDCQENLSYILQNAQGLTEDAVYQKEQESRRKNRRKAMNVIGLFLMLGSVMLVLAGIYVPPLWAKAVFFFAGALLGIADFLYQHSRGKMLEAEQELEKAKEALRRETERKKTGEAERLNWQLEKIKESLREKQQIYKNLKDSMEGLRETDGRLDQLEEKIQMAEQALGELDREGEAEEAKNISRVNCMMTKLVSELISEDFGTLFLNEEMEICVRMPDKIVKLSEESYGTFEQVCFAARMAVGMVLTEEESMPILLDDSFAMYDKERRERAIKWLEKSGYQVILFTSAAL